MASNALAVVGSQTGALAVSGNVQINGIAEVFRLADALSRAEGFVPSAYVGKPNAIAAAILTGIELNMGPMESLREVNVVKGRPTLSSGCMLARAIRAGVRVEWMESSATTSRLKLTRSGVSYEQAWTIEDAKRAGLLDKDGPWRTYPAAMLRARAISAAVRAFCPDVIGGGGLYTPEEAADMPPVRRAELVAETHDEVGELRAPESTGTAAPERFADCVEADELQAFGAKRRAAFAKLTNGRRGEAQRACDEAAKRCGIDPNVARAWCGLVDEEAA